MDAETRVGGKTSRAHSFRSHEHLGLAAPKRGRKKERNLPFTPRIDDDEAGQAGVDG